MKNLICLILFVGFVNLYGQEEQVVKVGSIEEATTISLSKARDLIKDKNDKIIISYEYVYNLDNIGLSENDYVKIYEYDMNSFKNGEYVYILKILINVDRAIYIDTLLFKCIKKSKKNIELTYIQNDTSTYIIE